MRSSNMHGNKIDSEKIIYVNEIHLVVISLGVQFNIVKCAKWSYWFY